jgi:hypothetical protein
MFVGGNGADLRKFTGVFLGTPAENCAAGCGVTQPGWPVLLTGNNISTSPVYDRTTGQIFIADNGGFLYSVTNPASPTVPTVTKSARIGFSLGIVDSPIVDPVAGMVYVFVSNDSATLPVTGNTSRVFQFATNFATGTSGTSVTVGDSSGAVKAFAGDFDNTYYNSASGNAGNLYVCGSVTGAVNYIPTLWQIPMAGGTLGAPVQGPALATTNATTCGPVVEIFNPNAGVGTDWIFTSVTANKITAAPISCPVAGGAGCIMSFDVTSGAAISAITPTVGHTAVTGGTSGFSFDNTVGAGTLAGASQVYFTPLLNQVCTTSGGTGGCAIQAAQSNLN